MRKPAKKFTAKKPRRNGKLLVLYNKSHIRKGRGYNMGETALVGKLTIAAMGCKAAKVVGQPDGQNKLPLCHIIGKATDLHYQDDRNNPGSVHTAFIGNFEGINMETGNVFHSGRLFLPKGISEMVETALKGAQKEDKNASVSFAFELRSVKAKNPIGYSYEAVALKQPQKEDELADLRKLLTAPKPEAAQAKRAS